MAALSQVLISTPEGYATWVKLHDLVGDPVSEEIRNAQPAAPNARRRTRGARNQTALSEQQNRLLQEAAMQHDREQSNRAAMARVAAASQVRR